jgi:hypothetical protein
MVPRMTRSREGLLGAQPEPIPLRGGNGLTCRPFMSAIDTLMAEDTKKKLTPFQRFVTAVARVPKDEVAKIEEAERRKKPARPNRKSA